MEIGLGPTYVIITLFFFWDGSFVLRQKIFARSLLIIEIHMKLLTLNKLIPKLTILYCITY